MEDVQRVILKKLEEAGAGDGASSGLELRDLLEDQDLKKLIEYAPAYERVVRSEVRYLIEQSFIECSDPLWVEELTAQDFPVRKHSKLSMSAKLRVTKDGSDLLRLLDTQAEEMRDMNTARPLPLEKAQAVPSSLVGLLGGELKGKFSLFIAAGASTSAGIPCGRVFQNKVLRRLYGESLGAVSPEEEFRKEFEEEIAGQELTLEMMMSLLTKKFGNPALRPLRSEVDGDLEPPPGYYSLAYLVRHGFFKLVFTVNFDELLEKACDEEIGPGTYDVICEVDRFRSLAPIPTEDWERPVLVKLHGTFSLESTLVVSWEDVQRLPRAKARFLDYYASHYPLVVVGYSGRDPDIGAVLRESSRESQDNRMFWVSPNDLETGAREILGFYRSSSNHIWVTSDGFFDELEHRLIGGYPRLQHEVNMAILDSGRKGIDREQIVQEILVHPSWGHRVYERYKGRHGRLLRDVEATLQSLIEKGRIEYDGEGVERRYWD